VTLRGRLAALTPPGLLAGTRAILTATPADSRKNATQLGTSWRSSPNRPGLPSSSCNINARNSLRPSTVSLVTYSISTYS
jgi:hypothetical protein